MSIFEQIRDVLKKKREMSRVTNEFDNPQGESPYTPSDYLKQREEEKELEKERELINEIIKKAKQERNGSNS